MIDTQELVDFGKEYSMVLDTFQQLKDLEAPTEAEGMQGFEKWFREFRHVFLMMTVLPDPDRLLRFAEHLDEVLSKVGGADRPPPEAEKEELLPIPIPDGTAENQMLRWDHTKKTWVPVAAPDADFKVLQRKADDSIGWDYVRAH